MMANIWLMMANNNLVGGIPTSEKYVWKKQSKPPTSHVIPC